MQDFFEKIPKNEKEIIFANGIFEKCQLTLHGDKTPVVVKVKFVVKTHFNSTRMYVIPNEINELKDKICAFSFRIGTRVYFFKSKILMDGKGFYIDSDYVLFELKRRRHVRFEVPETHPYECSVVTPMNRNIKIKGEIINFSESGIRIRVQSDLAIFQKDNSVILSLKIGKRSTFYVACDIKFVGRKVKINPELGLAFVGLNPLKKDKILNICEDLSRAYLSVIKNKKGT